MCLGPGFTGLGLHRLSEILGYGFRVQGFRVLELRVEG